MSTRSRLVSLAFVTLLVVSSLGPVLAQSSLVDPSCQASPGRSIQRAINRAVAGSTVVVCEGIYGEQVIIPKAVHLQARPGAVLDGGTLLGERTAILVSSGTSDVVVSGFEIRNYDDAFSSDDNSNGIVLAGNNRNVRIQNNSIHDVAQVSIASAGPDVYGLTIANNSLSRGPLYHVFVQGASHVTVRQNELHDAAWAVVLAGVSNASISSNILKGDGEAGLVIAPHLSGISVPLNVTIESNQLSGGWKRGIWAATGQDVRIHNNVIDATETHVVLGGDTRTFEVSTNPGEIVVESADIQSIFDTIQDPPAPAQTTSPSQSTATSAAAGCAGGCARDVLKTLLDVLLPRTAKAQTPPPEACDSTCTAIINTIVTQALNPLADPSVESDLARLQACAGASNACLTDAFFTADGSPANAWTQQYTGGIEVTVEFIDAGIRRTSETKAHHFLRSDLDDTFTTIVLCRVHIGPEVQNCATVPRIFDYGLDVTWSDTSLARHISTWRIQQPSNETHDSFDRLHGTDATLFYKTSRPHHADTPVSGEVQLPGDAPDARPVTGGALTLACQIAPSPAVTTPSGCPAFELARDNFSASLLWCLASSYGINPLATHDESIHNTYMAEASTGLFAWSESCGPTNGTIHANWTTFFTTDEIKELAAAQSEYMNSTLAGDAQEANAAAERAGLVFLRAGGKHLALNVTDHGMPLHVDEDRDHDAIMLEWIGEKANLHLESVASLDARLGWLRTQVPQIVAFTPARLSVAVDYQHITGDVYHAVFQVILDDEPTRLTRTPLLVDYDDTLYGHAIAIDPDNRNLTSQFDPASQRIHTYPLLNVTSGGTIAGQGLIDVGFSLPKTAESYNISYLDIFTANSSGLQSNVEGAILPTVQRALTDTFTTLDALKLGYFSGRVQTLEIRALPPGEQVQTSFELVYDPLRHTLPPDVAAPLLEIDATPALGALTPRDLSIADGAVRMSISIPFDDEAERASTIASILRNVSGSVDIVAIEVEDVPLTSELDVAIQYAVEHWGLIILAPADTLPEGMWDDPAQDKLLSIRGLGALPEVFTIGIGSVESGVSPASRLGPTPRLFPKPDFVAPGPASAVAAVMNALPFFEATRLLGIHDIDLVRSYLASIAVPIKNQAGTAATHWEQGYGALDLSTILDLPTTSDLLNTTGRTAADVLSLLPSLENETNVLDTNPRDILGVVASAEQLVRATLAKLTLEVVIDSPALPQVIQADFGIVNQEREGAAYVDATDLDPVLGALSDWTRMSLLETGYDESVVDTIMNDLIPKIEVHAGGGELITTNVTHYNMYDTLRDDTLYTMYRDLLQSAYEDRGEYLADVTPDDLARAQAPLEAWRLPEYHFVTEETGRVRVLTSEDELCQGGIPGDELIAFAQGISSILGVENSMIEHTTRFAQLLPDGVGGEDTVKFLNDPARQLLCTNEVRDALESLRARASILRNATRTPWGPLNDTEYLLGTFNETPLGRELNDTFTAAGVSPFAVAGENSTIVLDRVIDALDRAILLLEEKLELLDIPTLHANAPEYDGTIVADMRTDPARTRDAPLGFYVGLARMRTHDVQVNNPIKWKLLGGTESQFGLATRTRSLTVPLPSFLYLAPTLNLTQTYRDGSPTVNATIRLERQEVDLYEQVDVNVTPEVNGFLVPLTPNPESTLRNELTVLEETRQRLVRMIDQVLDPNASKPGGKYFVFANAVLEQAQPYLENVTKRMEEINLTLELSPPLELERSLDYEGALTNVVSSLTSRLTYQSALTNESGTASLPNLFPGSYTLVAPYSYAIQSDLSEQHAFTPAGDGGFQGPFVDPSEMVAQTALQFEDQLLDLAYMANELDANDIHRIIGQPVTNDSDPTTGAPERWEPTLSPRDATYTYGDEPPRDPPAACNGYTIATCDFLPIFELSGRHMGPYHQSNLTLTGPDYLAAACSYLTYYGELANTQLRWQYCDGARIRDDLLTGVLDLLEIAECMLTGDDSKLEDDEAAQDVCRSVRDTEGTLDACERGDLASCANATYVQHVADAALNLTLLPGVAPTVTLAYPFVHSPTRLMLTKADTIGFTTDAILPYARELNNYNDAHETPLRDAIDTALANARATANTTSQPATTPPPRYIHDTNTVAQGVAAHSTDRVSGLDWSHYVLRARVHSGETPQLSDQLGIVNNYPSLESDRLKITNLRLNVSALEEEAFGAGLDESDVIRAEYAREWPVPVGGLTIPDSVQDVEVSATAACSGAASLTALPSSFLPCEAIESFGTRPNIMGVGGVDNVQFTSALLEGLGSHVDWVTNASARAEIIRAATNSSVTGPGETWYRTEDALALDVEPSVEATALGVLQYATPVPVNEYVQVRLEGQFFTQNMGALMITTLSDRIAAALPSGLVELDLTTLGMEEVDHRPAEVAFDGDTPIFEPRAPRVSASSLTTLAQVATALEAHLDAQANINEGDATLFRIDGIGLPFGAEAKFDGHMSGFTMNQMVIASPPGITNYSRVHEFNTRGTVEATNGGPDNLHVIIVYFPLVGSSDDPANLSQKLIVRNLTIQLTTYLGYALPAEASNSYTQDVPVRYAPRVEDWKLLYALPDATRGSSTLTLDVNSRPITVSAADYYAAPKESVQSLETECVDTVAPGYQPNRFWREPRGFPAETAYVHQAGRSDCGSDEIRGLRPHHTKGIEYARWRTTVPSKFVADVIPYMMNVEANEFSTVQESMTGERPWGTGGVRCNILCLPEKAEPQEVSGALGDVVDKLRDLQDRVGRTTGGMVDLTRTQAFMPLDIDPARPFTLTSFNAGAQGGHSGAFQAGAPLHHWLVIRGDQLGTAFAANPAGLTLHVENAYPTNGPRWTPPQTAVPAQALRLYNMTDYHSLVEASALTVSTTGEGSASGLDHQQTIHLSTLWGHGKAGVGVALDIEVSAEEEMYDTNRADVLRGLRAATITSVEVTARLLGGSETVGDCANISVYSYVHPYFRCTGVKRTVSLEYTNRTTLALEPCYANVMDVVNPLVDHMLYQAVIVPGEFYSTLALGDKLQALFGTLPPSDAPILRKAPSEGFLQTMDLMQGHTVSQSGLVSCMDSVVINEPPHAEPIFVPTQTEAQPAQAFAFEMNAAEAAARAQNLDEAASHMAAAVRLLHPDFTSEPPRLLTVGLGRLGGLESGFTTLTGPTDLDYQVREWSTKLEAGWLNATITPASGAASITTLVQYPPTEGVAPLEITSGGSTLPFELVHGTQYNLTLVGIDDHAYRASARLDLLVDNVAPSITTGLPANVYSNQAASLSWNAVDETSGLDLVRLERLIAPNTWSTIHNFSVLRGTTSPTNATYVVDPVAVGASTGTTLTYRLVVYDRAGNQKTSSSVVLKFDFTPPFLRGAFWNANESSFVQDNMLGVEAYAQDMHTTLANFTASVKLGNQTITSRSLGHTAYWWTLNWSEEDASKLRPGKRYELVATATDQAGNTASKTLAHADIVMFPNITMELPEIRRSGAHTRIIVRGFVNQTSFPISMPDSVNITGIDDATGEVRKRIVILPDEADWNGSFEVEWNVSNLTGLHDLNVEAQMGLAKTTLQHLVDITPPPTSVSNQTQLEWYDTQSYSPAPGTRHLYSFQHQAACGPTFYIRVRGDQGTHMKMYVGTPADPTNPAQYQEQRTSESPQQFVRWEGPTPGTRYYVLVEHAAGPATPYTVRYETSPLAGSTCNQGGAPDTDRAERAVPVTEITTFSAPSSSP